ncbi:MAG: hypothetical protein JKY70_03025 [Mucilaginibacter sp.]|nr:hypothetical protein [Mucilaginibacter sp.]
MTRSQIILVALLFVSFCSFGQKKRSKGLSLAEMDRLYNISQKHSKCFFNGKFTADERRTFLPFNHAAEVRLISYKWNIPREANDPDSLPVFIPVAQNAFAINQLKLEEQKTLSNAGIDSLTNIFFNYGYTPVRSKNAYILEDAMSCYEPHNAVVFLDADGKVVYYFDVCFSCLRHNWSTPKVKNVIYCDGKYELLRKFFASQGVIYGTKRLHSD